MNESGEHLDPAFRDYPLPLRELEPPPPGEVHLWYLDLVRLGSPLHASGDHRPEALSPRQQRTIRRFYLRLLLGSYLEVPGKDVSIQRAVKGKPVLDPAAHVARLEFSVAASHGSYLVGVASEGALGVDLEPRGRCARRPLALARRYFNEAEVRALEALPEKDLDRAFLHAWACKEAVVKAAGHGIANRFNRFSVSVSPDAAPGVLAMDDDDPKAWRLAIVRPGDSHLGAVALRHAGFAMRCFTLVPPHEGTGG